MVKVLDEHERTMAFAEVALGQIRSLRQTAIPRNYEIWYVYATGYNAPLNKIINETLARHGKLTEGDLEQIYETYLSHIKTTDRIDKVGARVIGEIDDVMKVLSEALGMTGSYDASLSGATEKLSSARSSLKTRGPMAGLFLTVFTSLNPSCPLKSRRKNAAVSGYSSGTLSNEPCRR